MTKPTGKLLFAYRTIKALNERIAELEKERDALVKACRTVARKESRIGNYNENIESLDSVVDSLKHDNVHKDSYPASCSICGQ